MAKGRFTITQNHDGTIIFLPECHPQSGVTIEYHSRNQSGICLRCVECRKYTRLRVNGVCMNFVDLLE
jgi:hypothetical protein